MKVAERLSLMRPWSGYRRHVHLEVVMFCTNWTKGREKNLILIDPHPTETENVYSMLSTAAVYPLPAYVSFVAFVHDLCMLLQPLVSPLFAPHISVFPPCVFVFSAHSHHRLAISPILDFRLSALLIYYEVRSMVNITKYTISSPLPSLSLSLWVWVKWVYLLNVHIWFTQSLTVTGDSDFL